MADDVINVNLPGEPARKVTTQTPSSTIKTKTAPVAAAIADMAAAEEQLNVANVRKTDALVEQAKVDEYGSGKALELEQTRASSRAGAQIELGKQVDEAKRLAAEKRAAMERAGNIEPLLTGWKAVLAGVLQGVSTWSHVRAGGTGTAPGVEAFNAAIARDRQQKIDAFTRSKEFVELAESNVDKAELALRQRLQQIDNDHISAGNLLSRRLDNMKARFKTTEAKASAEATQAEIARANAEKRLKVESDFAPQIQRHGTSTTISEQADGGAAGRLKPAQEAAAADLNAMAANIEKVLANPVSPKAREKYQDNKAVRGRIAETKGPIGALMEIGGRKVDVVPRSDYQGLNERERAGVRAREELRAKQQKIVTGLAAPIQEQQDIMSRYGVDPTDSPETEREKMQMFAQEIRNRAVQTGPLQPQYLKLADDIEAKIGRSAGAPAQAAPATAPGAAWAPGDRVVKGGKTFERRADGWYEVGGGP